MAPREVSLVAVTTDAVIPVRDSSATKTSIGNHKCASLVLYFYKNWAQTVLWSEIFFPSLTTLTNNHGHALG